MLKVVTYPSIDDQIGRNFLHIDDTSTDMTKIAGVTLPPLLQEFLKTYTPSSPNVDVYVSIAMGAGEYYGPNLNGDFFPKDMLEECHPTFVSHGKVFKFHMNKPTDTSYGRIAFSEYDKNMHRVVLLMEVNGDKLPEINKKYRAGEPVYVSMGCAVPYDVCSICGNKAKSPAYYCKHLTQERLKIYPDGRRAYMINPRGRFFDISWVMVPADQTAFFITKLPSAEVAKNTLSDISDMIVGNRDDEEVILKAASLNTDDMGISKISEKKISTMLKQIVLGLDNKKTRMARKILAKAKKMRKEEPKIASEDIKILSKYPIEKVLATLASMGIILKPKEFQDLVAERVDIPDRDMNLRELLDHVGFELSLSDLKNIPCAALLNFDKTDISDEIAGFMSKYLETKSYNDPHFIRRIAIIKVSELDESNYTEPGIYKEVDFNKEDPLSDMYAKQLSGYVDPNATPESYLQNKSMEIFKNRTIDIAKGLALAYLGMLIGNNRLVSSLGESSKKVIMPISIAAGTLGLLGAGMPAYDMATDSNREDYLDEDSREIYNKLILEGKIPNEINPYYLPVEEAKNIKTSAFTGVYGALTGTLLGSYLKAQDQVDPYRFYKKPDDYSGIKGYARNTIKKHPILSGIASELLLRSLPVVGKITNNHPWLTMGVASLPWVAS